MHGNEQVGSIWENDAEEGVLKSRIGYDLHSRGVHRRLVRRDVLMRVQRERRSHDERRILWDSGLSLDDRVAFLERINSDKDQYAWRNSAGPPGIEGEVIAEEEDWLRGLHLGSGSAMSSVLLV
jgi:hypothetical protein